MGFLRSVSPNITKCHSLLISWNRNEGGLSRSTSWLQWLVSEDRDFSQVIHSGCYDSWMLIFFPDFTAVSLDKALKDRANRVLVSNMALFRKLGALVLLRWWWCCSQVLSSGYSYFREQNVEQKQFVWILQDNLMPFLWEEDNTVLLSKPWKAMQRDAFSILIIP